MHENKNDAPTSKVFYRPLEASIRGPDCCDTSR